MFSRRHLLQVGGAAALISSTSLPDWAAGKELRIAMVVKALGIGFFDLKFAQTKHFLDHPTTFKRC